MEGGRVTNSLLGQLPGIVREGRKQAEKILENLEGSHRVSLQTREWVLPSKDARDSDWTNRLIYGDSLLAMAALLAGDEHTPSLRGKIDLIYIDPPFGPETACRAKAPAPGTDPKSHTPAAGRSVSFATWPDDAAAYLARITPRLILMRELLSASGSIFIHLDWHVGHHVKLILDDLFGRDNFRNEIVLPNQAQRYLQIRHDHLFWYTKSAATQFPPLWIQKHPADGPEDRWGHFWDTTDHSAMRYDLFGITPTIGRWIWQEARALKAVRNYERFCEEGGGRTIEKFWYDTGATMEFLRPSPDDGVPQYWQEPAGTQRADTLRVGIAAGPGAGGRLAEKNEAYLAQIVEFATGKQGIVAGFGGGSGSTAAVAEKLGRRWLIAGLDSPECTVVRKRLIDQGARPFLYQAIGDG
jgi:adenine-specific DNA-methyltransferase